ncbi:MAG TPA: PspA/IM30 family protein [Leptolyngbyaceae cyanobacterium]
MASEWRVSMGLIDRVLRVVRANINHLIGESEDPEKVLEQAVLDMQEQLIHLRQAVAQAIATKKRTERDVSNAQSNADSWQSRAQLALQKGDENLAREALVRRKSYLDNAKIMQSQLESQSGIINKLKEDLRTLEGKIAEARTKKDLYIARARSAQASQKLNEMMNKFNPSGSLSAFERMEEKVLQLEARSEAIAQLGTNELEQKFAALEGNSEVDGELAAMKAKTIAGKNAAQLPSVQSSPGRNSELDEELEKLRSQLEKS